MPVFSTLSRRKNTCNLTIPYRDSKGQLHLLVDSNGIKVEGRVYWHKGKHGASICRLWRMTHLGTDEETLEIRAVEVAPSHVGDARMLRDLLAQIPAEEEIATVTTDGAFDTRACHDGHRPPRHEILRASKHLGQALWRSCSGYHCSSRFETKNTCVKLLVQRLMSRDFDRKVEEVQI